MEQEAFIPCGDLCDWSLFASPATEVDPKADPKTLIDRTVCGPGKGFCIPFVLLSPLQSEPRSYHPQKLRDATSQINAILNDVVKDNPPADRHLAFLKVPGGLMLAWVEHGVSVPHDAVTPDSPPDEIRRALGLSRPDSAA
jgi:hypothetical protein